MTSIVYLIKQIAPGLFFICAAALLIHLRNLFQARHKLTIAEFDLERELAERDQANAITWGGFIIEIALAVGAIAFVVEPTLRADLLSGLITDGGTGAAQPGPERFETSTPGGSGEDVAARNATAQAPQGTSVRLILTAAASPTPVGTIIVGYPTPSDCSDQAFLEVPAPGQVLFDSVEIIGKANVPNFAFYKFELAGPSTGGEFAPILGEKTSPVIEKGTLGLLPLFGLAPGDYTFRLAVFDNSRSLKASCSVRVNIILPPPSPTPPGG